jgi:hypothetical protein
MCLCTHLQIFTCRLKDILDRSPEHADVHISVCIFHTAGLFFKDLSNMGRFGPSLETCGFWFVGSGGDEVKAEHLQVANNITLC